MRRCLCSECCLLYGENVFLFLVAEKARVGGKRFGRPVTDKEVKPEDVQASHTLVCAFNFCPAPALIAILVCYGLLYFALLGTPFPSPCAPAESARLTSNATLFYLLYWLY